MRDSKRKKSKKKIFIIKQHIIHENVYLVMWDLVDVYDSIRKPIADSSLIKFSGHELKSSSTPTQFVCVYLNFNQSHFLFGHSNHSYQINHFQIYIHIRLFLMGLQNKTHFTHLYCVTNGIFFYLYKSKVIKSTRLTQPNIA